MPLFGTPLLPNCYNILQNFGQCIGVSLYSVQLQKLPASAPAVAVTLTCSTLPPPRLQPCPPNTSGGGTGTGNPN